ncbi:MAG: tRNA preQ1(34) S-adenosylmethionine ribosyltransferase-isomerase QueA [Candidatus Pacebacteria bacterium]|nr:tRNA preQ1(34) S-adenosylmethionine ribosyltransferase-isomerase QueA [Candidatus Paceibacterota bacterium]
MDQFDYDLPPEQIAQRPIEPRHNSRLMIVRTQPKARQKQLELSYRFSQLPQILAQDYQSKVVLVRNNTKVIPARIVGQKSTGGEVELLLLKQKQVLPDKEIWECLTKPGLKPGQIAKFSPDLRAVCQSIDGYTRLIEFNQAQSSLMTSLLAIGQTPTPPYIDWQSEDEQELRRQYQTIYAKHQGSAAAPTAGLHFSKEVNQALEQNGVEIEEVTLHVGLGTFQPVKTSNIRQHQMHSEWYRLENETAKRLNRAKKQGKRIIAVGTTTTRVLESCADYQSFTSSKAVLNPGQATLCPGQATLNPSQATLCPGNAVLNPGQGETDVFITPGYKFKFVDGLITNFHLPKSTLLMLVSALVSQPNTNQPFINFNQSLVGQGYQKAIAAGYRFYSFGDSMLIV